MAIELFAIFNGTPVSGSGSVALNGTTAVVGTTTAFLTQAPVGTVIEVNGEARVVTVTTDNTHLTVGTAFTQTASGQDYTLYPMVAVEDLTADLLPPASEFQRYSKLTPLADGTVRGLGWSLATWKWGWITAAQRTALKALCSGASVETFIKTLNDTNAFAVYRAVLVWPEREQKYAAHVLDFALQFRKVSAI
jgi:hypothetical protein